MTIEQELKVQIESQMEKLLPRQGDVILVYFPNEMSQDDVKQLRSVVEGLVQKIRVNALVLPRSVNVSQLSKETLEQLLAVEVAKEKEKEGHKCGSTRGSSTKKSR
jgi:hypothetical protein